MNVEKMCRTCMAENSAMLSLYGKARDDCGQPTLATLLQSMTTIRPRLSDGLPGHICLACISDLNRAVSFKQQSERSEHTLRSFVVEQEQNDHHNKPSSSSSLKTCPICDQSYGTDDKLAEHISNDHNSAEPAQHFADHDDEISIYEVDDGSAAESIEQIAHDDDDDDGQYTIIPTQIECVDDDTMLNEECTIEVVPIELSPSPQHFKCSKCGASFVKEKSLNIHQKSNKCMEKSFECFRCKRVFIRKENLMRHMTVHHLMENGDNESNVQHDDANPAEDISLKYKCQFCNKGSLLSTAFSDCQ